MEKFDLGLEGLVDIREQYLGGHTDRGPNVGLGESEILEEEKQGLGLLIGFANQKRVEIERAWVLENLKLSIRQLVDGRVSFWGPLVWLRWMKKKDGRRERERVWLSLQETACGAHRI
ncbi:hypothetical protein SLA2020_274350 [Shorea laevis]